MSERLQHQKHPPMFHLMLYSDMRADQTQGQITTALLIPGMCKFYASPAKSLAHSTLLREAVGSSTEKLYYFTNDI